MKKEECKKALSSEDEASEVQGESEEETVRREIREETGLENVKIIPGFREHTKLIFRRTYNLRPEEKK
jgi:8-oxo-dGTP pyrophosphatase MutT (NUDIX family)